MRRSLRPRGPGHRSRGVFSLVLSGADTLNLRRTGRPPLRFALAVFRWLWQGTRIAYYVRPQAESDGRASQCPTPREEV